MAQRRGGKRITAFDLEYVTRELLAAFDQLGWRYRVMTPWYAPLERREAPGMLLLLDFPGRKKPGALMLLYPDYERGVMSRAKFLSATRRHADRYRLGAIALSHQKRLDDLDRAFAAKKITADERIAARHVMEIQHLRRKQAFGTTVDERDINWRLALSANPQGRQA